MNQFAEQCQRVLSLTHKPTFDELKLVTKSASIGLLLIGLLGFIVFAVSKLVTQ